LQPVHTSLKQFTTIIKMAEKNPPPPPFRPPSPTATSVSPTSYRSARQNELDALRSKGLAKIFNRHFTDATEKITLEREAADAALIEIIARKAEIKANPKSFETDGLTVTQLDALHMQLQKRKQDVQRKEQETKELYKRYVSQYGGSEAMAQRALHKQDSAKFSISALSSTMPVLHENRESDIMRQTDLVTARTKEKNNCAGIGSPTARKLEDGSFYESDQTRGPSPNTRVGRLNKKVSTAQSPPLLDITSEQNSNSRLDSPDVITSNGNPTTSQPQDKPSVKKNVLDGPRSLSPSNSFGNMSGLDSLLGGVMVNVDDDSDDDADSIMSGLTSMDGATVAIAEFKLTEFLKEETDNIRKMFSSNIGESEYDDDDDDDDLKSLGTVQTHTSLESQRAVIAAKKAEDLVKKMEEDTAWMNNPDLLDDDTDEENDEGEKDSQSSQSKPQWIAYYSDEHKRVYYYNSDTKQTCWTEPRDAVIDKSALDKSKLTDDNKCDDEDTVIVKDYTKAEPQDTQTQTRGITRSMSENLAAIDQYRPNSDGMSIGSGSISRTSRTSKVMIFKRKRALKRRRRNRIIVAFTVVCSLFGVGFYKSREQWMPVLGLQTVRQKAIEEERVLKVAADAAAEKAREIKLRKEEEQRKLAAEEQRKKTELAAKKKAEKEQKEAELVAKKKAELEAKKKAELEVKKKAEEKRIEAELAAQKKAEEDRIKAELAAQKKAEEDRIKDELAAQKKVEKAEKAAKKKAEADRKKAELAAKKNAEEQRRLAELAAKEKVEEERRVAELAAKEKADEERRVAEMAAKKAEEERRVAKLAAKEAERKRIKAELEAKAKAEEERMKVEIAAKAKAEEKRIKTELEAKAKAEEKRIKAELEAKAKAEEERKKVELAAKAKAEEEREEEERKLAEEKKRKKEEEEKLTERIRKELEVQIREDERRKTEERIREEERKKSELELVKSNNDVASLVLFTRNKTRCHIPFACYFIKQCKAAVRKKPLFDIKWVVDSMMQ